jgi:hypothetical protein
MAHPEILKGVPAPRSLGKVDGEALGARENVAVEVDSVKYSHEELKRVMDQISTTQRWTSDVKASLATWGIDPKADKVEVGLTQVTPAIVQEASALFGDKVELVTRSRDKNAMGPPGQERLDRLHRRPRVKPGEQGPSRHTFAAAHRFLDSHTTLSGTLEVIARVHVRQDRCRRGRRAPADPHAAGRHRGRRDHSHRRQQRP